MLLRSDADSAGGGGHACRRGRSCASIGGPRFRLGRGRKRRAVAVWAVMRVDALARGLWRWTAEHTDVPGGRNEVVGCVYCEPPPDRFDRLVLIDPLVPREPRDAARFWDALDRDVDRLALPVSVLVGNRLHRRSAFVVADRYRERHGADVRAHDDIAGRPGFESARGFRHREPLPAGIEPWAIDGFGDGETAFHIPHHDALVVARCVIGAGASRVRLAPAGRTEIARSGDCPFRDSIARLLDLSFERLLPSLGAPVLRNGRGALREAMESGPASAASATSGGPRGGP